MDQTPDANRIIKVLENVKNHDSFTYCHIQRLHPPFLSTDDRQTPRLLNIDDLTEAQERNYLKLYIAQLGEIDFQLSQIIGYLKESNQYDSDVCSIG